jgi:hypothetical protein
MELIGVYGAANCADVDEYHRLGRMGDHGAKDRLNEIRRLIGLEGGHDETP